MSFTLNATPARPTPLLVSSPIVPRDVRAVAVEIDADAHRQR